MFNKNIKINFNVTKEEYKNFIINESLKILRKETNYVIDAEKICIRSLFENTFFSVYPELFIEVIDDIFEVDEVNENENLINQNILKFYNKKIYSFSPIIKNINEELRFFIDLNDQNFISQRIIAESIPPETHLLTVHNQTIIDLFEKEVKGIDIPFSTFSLAVKSNGEMTRLIVLSKDLIGENQMFHCINDKTYNSENELLSNYKKDVIHSLSNYFHQKGKYEICNINEILNNKKIL